MKTEVNVMPDPPEWDSPFALGVTDCGDFLSLGIGVPGDDVRVSLHVHTVQQADALLGALHAIRDALATRKGPKDRLPLHA